MAKTLDSESAATGYRPEQAGAGVQRIDPRVKAAGATALGKLGESLLIPDFAWRLGTDWTTRAWGRWPASRTSKK